MSFDMHDINISTETWRKENYSEMILEIFMLTDFRNL